MLETSSFRKAAGKADLDEPNGRSLRLEEAGLENVEGDEDQDE